MNKDEFRAMVKELNIYYGLEKTVSQARFDQWFEKVRDVPGEAISYIKSKIEDSNDSLPRNIPKNIKQFYQEWRNLNSGKLADYPRTNCNECRGHGFIWCRRPAVFEGRRENDALDQIVWEQTTFRCSKCENWKPHIHWKSMPAATIQELRDRGYKIVFDSLSDVPAVHTDLRQVANDLTVPF